MATGLSLHIGLNRVDPKHYQGWAGPLVACEADAEDMDRITKSRGFTTTVLKTDGATRAAVTGAIAGAATKLKSGDIFVVSYSGHGGQLPDLNGDEKDEQDETWCLFDGELVDDELFALWAKFPAGVRIAVFSDSCHSGTVTRSPYEAMRTSNALSAVVDTSKELRFRAMPNEVALRTYRANRAQYDEILRSADPNAKEKIAATVILLSGCQDNQTSLDGDFNGLFTSKLLRVWVEGAFEGSYHDLQRAILRQMPPTQSPNYLVFGAANAEFKRQKPFTI